MATLITDKTAIFFSQRVISYQIIGTASFTACLRPQPNRHNCSLITSLPHWRWRPTKNFKSGTARTCSNGVMAIMGTKRRVLQCMVCMFEVSPKLESTLRKRVPKLLFIYLYYYHLSTAWFSDVNTCNNDIISDVTLFDSRMKEKNACPNKGLAWKREFIRIRLMRFYDMHLSI